MARRQILIHPLLPPHLAVALKTAEILLLLGALGLPLNWLLLAQVDRVHPRRTLSGRLLLAPATGLAVFACYTVFFFAAGAPVAAAVVFLPLLLALAWAVWYFFRPRRGRLPLLRHTRVSAWLLAGAGLAIVLLFYVWPFLKNPSLVFWHHAGTDGYMYMRAAEHAYSPGAGVIPFVGPYDASVGFTAETLRSFQLGLLADKPAAMSTLAGIAAVLGATPRAAFSPLVNAAVLILYLVLLSFAHLRLRLPAWAAAVFALFGAICPSVWMLSTHTFFGNTLALPLFALLLLLPRAFPSWGTAVILGLGLLAQFVIFPDGTPAIAGMLAVATPYLVWSAYRRRRLRRLGLAALLAIALAVALGFPFARPLLGTMHDRLMGVATGLTSQPAPSAGATTHRQRLEQVDWIWGALNVNTIPPQPLAATERPYVIYGAGLLAVFVVACLWRRRAGQLASYVAGFLLILLLGLAGLFRGDYELFRGLAVFAWLPLGAFCTLPWLLVPAIGTPRRLVARLVVLAALAPLLWHFFQVDRRHFNSSNENHFSDAQYTIRDLQDRINLGRAAGHLPLVLGTETPGHFGVFSSMMLFSNLRLGLSPAYHRFAFFRSQPGETAYYAAGVLRNLHYADITEPLPAENLLYRGANFEVVANDLIPFFDHDTLPPANAYPVDFLRRHNLPVARLFSAPTSIAFNNARARPVALVLQLAGTEAGDRVGYSFDGAPMKTATVNPQDNTVIMVSPVLSAGLHHLALAAPAHPLRITALWLREADAHGRPFDYDGVRRVRPAEAGYFQHMSPQPVRFFSQYGTNAWGDFVTTHSTTRLYFQPSPGAHRLRTSLRIDPNAYENLPPGQATDGITFEVALVGADGTRTVIFTRRVDPARVPADRGVLPVDLGFNLPAQTQLELEIGPGPYQNGARDWAGVGPLTID